MFTPPHHGRAPLHCVLLPCRLTVGEYALLQQLRAEAAALAENDSLYDDMEDDEGLDDFNS